MPDAQIHFEPPKPIWWKVIVGSVLLFATIDNHVNPTPNLLKASNAGERAAMNATAIAMAVLAIWLVVSGVRPVWRKISK